VKVLLDVLRAHGHEGVHAHQIGKDRASDSELLEVARREGRIVITADLDFPRLLALSGAEDILVCRPFSACTFLAVQTFQ